VPSAGAQVLVGLRPGRLSAVGRSSAFGLSDVCCLSFRKAIRHQDVEATHRIFEHFMYDGLFPAFQDCTFPRIRHLAWEPGLDTCDCIELLDRCVSALCHIFRRLFQRATSRSVPPCAR